MIRPAAGSKKRAARCQLALLAFVISAWAPARAGGPIFSDGFESAGFCGWNDIVGAPADGDDSENTAVDLGTGTQCAGTLDRSSILHGRLDTDYFRIRVTDVSGCALAFDLSGSLGGARLCGFVTCTAGGVPNIVCAPGALAAVSPAGRPGCCSTTLSLLEDVDCGIDDTVVIFFRMDTGGSACTAYVVHADF
jgi:hypothetical protein